MATTTSSGAILRQHRGREIPVKLNGYPRRTGPVFQIARQVGDGFLEGRPCGDVQCAAQGRSFIDQPDLCAPQRRGGCGRQAGRASSRDQNANRFRQRFRLEQVAADERIDGAAQGLSLMEAGQAEVAGQAGPDLVLPALLDLDGKLRIRNEGPGCSGHADVAALHRLAENIGAVKPPDADDRDRNRLLERPAVNQKASPRDIRRRGHPKLGQPDPRRCAQIIHADRFQAASDFKCFIET